jgi:hypothetical protein
MKEWKKWEIELLEIYKNQPTTTVIVAKLLSRPEEEVRKKMEELE